MSTPRVVRARPRWRRYFRWGATVLLTVSVAVLVASLWYSVHVWWRRAGFGVGFSSFYLNYAAKAEPRAFSVSVKRQPFAAQVRDTWRIFMFWEPWAGGRARHLEFPLWPLAAGAGLVAAVAWWLDPPRRRPRPGCCKACGYDLTGNVSGRCPECGTPTASRMRRLLVRLVGALRPVRPVPAVT